MDFFTYQREAEKRSQQPLDGPEAAVASLFGLAHETGSILNVYKRSMRDKIPIVSGEFLKEELGDLLWYAAAVATALGLNLEEIANENLKRIRDRYPERADAQKAFSTLPPLDASYPLWERFPRRLVVSFTEQQLGAEPTAYLTLTNATPNAFPNGRISEDGKERGFALGERLGAELDDNSRRLDGYRFHDAIHMGFMAVLGWSPTMRSLLKIKRKSIPETDRTEDGARAIFAEEGLAAVLSRLAERRNNFKTDESVDGDALVVVGAATVDLEVSRLPLWLWRGAVRQGFEALLQLDENHGGHLIADLDERKLTYSKEAP